MKKLILLTAIVSTLHVSGFLFPISNEVVATVAESPSSEFSFIRGHRQGKGIMLNWGMNSGNQVNEFRIESTNEDPSDPYSNWAIEGTVPGGDVRSFKFLDQTAMPGFNHYRIVAVMNNSTTIVSTVCTVRIVSH